MCFLLEVSGAPVFFFFPFLRAAPSRSFDMMPLQAPITQPVNLLRRRGLSVTAFILDITSAPHLDWGLGKESVPKTFLPETSTRAPASVVVPISSAMPYLFVLCIRFKNLRGGLLKTDISGHRPQTQIQGRGMPTQYPPCL